MATRSERLNRLVIGSPCTESWETMEGEGPQRFCARCQREVYDFAQMTAASIHADLHARRGKMCARMTRAGGRLLTAPAFEPPSAAAAPPRGRLTTVAATLMSAWLAAASAQAQRGAPAVAVAEAAHGEREAEGDGGRERRAYEGASGALFGRVLDDNGAPLSGVEVVAVNAFDGSQQTVSTGSDGAFRFAALPAGIYDVAGQADGYEVEPRQGLVIQPGEQQRAELTASQALVIAGGIGGAGSSPLRQLFAQSDLVVTAVAGPSTVVERDGKNLTVTTELRVETAFKGEMPARPLAYRHWEYEEERGWTAVYEPGTRLLAFLDRAEGLESDRPVFEGAEYGTGIKHLNEAERAAYEASLSALARVERRAERRGEKDPEEIVEWLVATAEEPLVSVEVLDEVAGAVAALAQRADAAQVSAEVAAADLLGLVDRFRGSGGALTADPRPDLLGAALTADHRRRLTAALLATEGLSYASWQLYEMVDRWDPAAASEWVARQLGAPDSPWDENEDVAWWLSALAAKLGDESLQALLSEGEDRAAEVGELSAGDASEEASKARQERLVALRRELRHQFAQALVGSLGAPPPPPSAH